MKKILSALLFIIAINSFCFLQLSSASTDATKIIIGKIIDVTPVYLVHPPQYAFCKIKVVSDNGEKYGIFVPRATTITDLNGKDMNGKWPGKGERAEIKYYTVEPGVNEHNYTASIRYVPSGYAQQSTTSMEPAKAATSTPASTLSSGFHQGEKIPVGKAVVYIYRCAGSGAGGAAIPFGVKANSKVLATLAQGGYYAYVTEPGNVEFAAFEIGFMAPTDISFISIDAKADQVYYIKGTHGKGMGGRARLESVSPDVGVNEIANCKLTTAK